MEEELKGKGIGKWNGRGKESADSCTFGSTSIEQEALIITTTLKSNNIGKATSAKETQEPRAKASVSSTADAGAAKVPAAPETPASTPPDESAAPPLSPPASDIWPERVPGRTVIKTQGHTFVGWTAVVCSDRLEAGTFPVYVVELDGTKTKTLFDFVRQGTRSWRLLKVPEQYEEAK